MNEDGTMARMPDLRSFSKKHGDIPIVTIQELISARMETECLVKEVASTHLPTEFGDFQLKAFQSTIDRTENLALVRGDLSGEPLVRMHSECLTGDALFSKRCDCGQQLNTSMKMIAEANNGVLIYMRKHEGRGIGLTNKLKAYQLQDKGLDTVEANRHLGFKTDLRHYGLGAQILRSLGIQQLKLLTNNPKKVVGLGGYGLSITQTLPIEVEPNPHNFSYLQTKRDKMGHKLDHLDSPLSASLSEKTK